MTDRAITPVLGLVLLVGLTAVAAVSILLVTVTLLGTSQSAVETTEAEQSLSQFAQSAERLAAGETDESEYDLGGTSNGDVRVDGDAGSFAVRIERANDTVVLTNGSLGAYEYEGPDGATLAFQGGGVWRTDELGGASIVRAPEFHYRARPDPTVTLPVVRFEETANHTPSSAGQIAVQERRAVYPAESGHTNPLRNGTVYLNVESEYCTGWESFFGSQTDGAVVERCSNGDGETAEGELLVQLSVPLHFGGLGSDTAIAEEITGAGDVTGSTSEGPHEMESATGVVEQKVEDCDDGRGENLSAHVSGGGLYCEFDDMDGDEYRVDPDGEDVEIAVDGRFEPDDLDIVDDGTVTVFVNSSALPTASWSDPNVIGNPSHPERLRIVVRSDCAVGGVPGPCDSYNKGGGEMDVHGLIYAPNSLVDFGGDAHIYGGIVAERINLRSGDSEINPDPDVRDVELEFERGGEPFYYLHVSETTLSFGG